MHRSFWPAVLLPVLALPLLHGAQPSSPVALATSPTPAPAGVSAATDSPRQRDRVLQKRNPIASEYQVIDVLGQPPGPQADGEGSDFRAFLPLTGGLLAQDETYRVAVFETMQLPAERFEPGFDARIRRNFGSEARRSTAELRLNVTAASRIIEDFDAVWSPHSSGTEQAPIYYQQRPQLGRETLYTRTRSAVFHVEHRLGPADTLFAQASWSDYLDHSVINQLDFDFGLGQQRSTGPTRITGATATEGDFSNVPARRYFRLGTTQREVVRWQIGGEHDGGEWSARYAAYHADWDNHIHAEGWNFRDPGLDAGYRLTADPYFPQILRAPGFDFARNGNASFFADHRHVVLPTRDIDYAARADLQRGWSVRDGTFWTSAGALHRRKERSNFYEGTVHYANPSRPLAIQRLMSSDAVGTAVRNRYDFLPPALAPVAARSLAAPGVPELVYSEPRSVIEAEQERYLSEEAVTGLYTYASWRRGNWLIEGGLRREFTDTATLGTVIVPANTDPGEGKLLATINENGDLVNIREVPGENSYATWLPSVAVEWGISKAWTMRAAAYEQLMRPQYFDIVAYRRVSLTTYKVREGNPGLGPVAIRTAVIALEHDSQKIGEWSLAAYGTDVSHFFYNAQVYDTFDGALYTISRIENGDDGTLRGVQAKWSGRMPAGAFTVSPGLAYTYSDSEAAVPTRPDRLPLPERAEHLLQAEIDWSSDRVGGSVAFSWQSEALDFVGPAADRDIYRDDVQSIDASLWLKVGRRWRATLSGQNIADSPERSYEGDSLRAIRNQYRGSTWRVGIEAEF